MYMYVFYCARRFATMFGGYKGAEELIGIVGMAWLGFIVLATIQFALQAVVVSPQVKVSLEVALRHYKLVGAIELVLLGLINYVLLVKGQRYRTYDREFAGLSKKTHVLLGICVVAVLVLLVGTMFTLQKQVFGR
jgi:hypothetical protein